MDYSPENFTKTMNQLIQLRNDNRIPEATYDGWYWLSNANMPKMLNREKFDEALLAKLPFVIEAHLYDAATQTSISIKNVDGAYRIIQYQLKDLDGYEVLERSYVGHRLHQEGPQPILKFKEVWKEEPDILCNGMKTLVPYFTAFVGFKN